MKRQLIFIYNGDSGLLNSLVHLMHKTLSPSTYECSLCALIYNGISLDKGWLSYVAQLDAEVEYCHRDVFQVRHGRSFQSYPLLLERTGETFTVLMAKADFDAVSDLDDLKTRLNTILMLSKSGSGSGLASQTFQRAL